MTPNKFQQDILDSSSRVTVVTAEPGSGLTTGLFMALAEEAIKAGPGSIVLYVRRTLNQAKGALNIALKALPPSRYSEQSGIITFDGPEGTHKIKLVDDAYVADSARCTGVAAIAFDLHIEPTTALSALIAGKKIFFADKIRDTIKWGTYCRIVMTGDNGRHVFTPQVDHVVGFLKGNPEIGHDYMCALLEIPHDVKEEMFYTRFVDFEK